LENAEEVVPPTYLSEADIISEISDFMPEDMQESIEEEVIEIVVEDSSSDDGNQGIIDQIFDLELEIEDTANPYSLGELEVLASDDTDKPTPDQPVDQPFKLSLDDQITAPLGPMDLIDDDSAFLVDEGVDINQPESLNDPEEMSNLSLKFSEHTDPMEELMALSERLDDGISDNHQDNLIQSLDGAAHDDLDEFLPMFTNNLQGSGNESDPFDFDLLSEEAL
jgi:hypothetical protein